VLDRVNGVLGEETTMEPGEIEVPEGCRLEIELDEYGFETELVVCDDPAETTAPAGEATGEPETTIAPETTEPSEPPALADWAGSAEARNLARRLRRVLIEQSGCQSSQELILLEADVEAAPTEIRQPLLDAVAALWRSAESCNVDAEAWRAATEEALDRLEQVAVILEEGAGGV
jgi:hypothetical protein